MSVPNSPQSHGVARSTNDQCSTFRKHVKDEEAPDILASPKTSSCFCGRSLESSAERVVRLTYLYGCLHGAIDQLLPACFKSLEKDMGLSPQSLGFITSASRISHVLTCPFWGFAIDCCARRRIFSLTALGWGISAGAVLYVTKQWQVLLLMCSLGTFMSAMGPLTQKVIAQEVPEGERGRRFGLLHFFQSFGRVLSLTVTTSISGLTILGIEGWRHAFSGYGLLSILVGLILAICVTDYPLLVRNGKGGIWYSVRDIAYIFSNESVWVMLLLVNSTWNFEYTLLQKTLIAKLSHFRTS